MAISENKLTYGLKNLYYAKKMVSADGKVTYATPVAIPGAKEIALPPVGETVKVYADNIVYTKVLVNQGYDGTVSVLNIPESFEVDILGKIKSADGVLIENAGAVASDFALLGEFDVDLQGKSKRWVLWNCSAGRHDHASTTKEETLDPNVIAIPITATPLEGTEDIKASVLGDESNTVWKAWFDSVYMPNVEPPNVEPSSLKSAK